MGFFHAIHTSAGNGPDTHPRHSSPTLFAAHASRTHVKAPQTDLHVKPYNSSGPTHDSPSKRPSRTKVTFQHGKAPKKHGGKPWKHQAAREPPVPNTDQPLSMLHPVLNRNQGPKGSIETKTSSLSMPKAMAEASKASGRTPWLNATLPKPSRLDLGDRFRFSLFGKKDLVFLSLSLEYLLEYPSIL